MPTNVPPQYRDAEERFRQAGTTQAKIAAVLKTTTGSGPSEVRGVVGGRSGAADPARKGVLA